MTSRTKPSDELSGDELLAELGVELEPAEAGGLTARQERILAGFEDILRFWESNKRVPQATEGRDIFERIYATRLEQLCKLPEEDLAVILPLDTHHLLDAAAATEEAELPEGDELLGELMGDTAGNDIGHLRHVSAPEPRETPEEVADRVLCKDFFAFRPLFEQAQAELQTRQREAKRFIRDASIAESDFFILRGDLVYVAGVGEAIQAPNGSSDARLRVIYANGTESNLLRRSLQRALHKDENGRRITQASLGPLFGDTVEPDDVGTGTIYVLRSLSKQPEIAAVRDVLHKIGVTMGRVEDRIADAENDATYLLAPVEIVAQWTLANVHRFKLEKTFHRLFAGVQLQMTIPDRFGRPVQPREWFLVPLPVIDQAVMHIRDESITEMVYDSKSATLKKA